MIVVLCGAEGAKAEAEWAARADVSELHAIGFYPQTKLRGVVVHTRPEDQVAKDMPHVDRVIGGDRFLWSHAEWRTLPEPLQQPAPEVPAPVEQAKKKRGRPPKVR